MDDYQLQSLGDKLEKSFGAVLLRQLTLSAWFVLKFSTARGVGHGSRPHGKCCLIVAAYIHTARVWVGRCCCVMQHAAAHVVAMCLVELRTVAL